MTKDALDDFPSKQEILKAISDAVYAQYPKKEWQGLSDDEIANLIRNKLLDKEQITVEDLLDLLLEQQNILERKNK